MMITPKLYNLLIAGESSAQEKAIERANQLFNNLKDLLYHQQSLVSKVFELVEELNENLRK